MLTVCVTAFKAAGEATGGVNHAVGLAMWQAQDAINSGHAVLLEVFVGLVAFALLVQAAVMVALAMVAVKAQKAIMAEVTVIKGKVMPLVDKSHALMTDLTPEIKAITTKVHDITQKVDVITAHIEEIAGVAKDKAHEFAPTISAANVTFGEANETAREVNQKTRAQVNRVNGMITSTLDATAALGKAIQNGISAPGREIAGVVTGVKASIDSFLNRRKRPASTPGSARPTAAAGWGAPAAVPGGPVSSAASGVTARPATSGGVPEAKASAEATASAATAAFAQAEERDLGL